MRIAAILFVLLFAVSAQAQDQRWKFIPPKDASSLVVAQNCMAFAGRGVMCLYVGCFADIPDDLGVLFSYSKALAGGKLTPPEMEISTEGKAAVKARLRLDPNPVELGSVWMHIATLSGWDGAPRLIEALRRGNRAVVRAQAGDTPLTAVISLSGSSQAIAQMLGHCHLPTAAGPAPTPTPVPAPAPVPARVPGTDAGPLADPEPGILSLVSIGKTCQMLAGSPAAASPEVVTLRDIDGDGRDDILLDFAGFSCSGSALRPGCNDKGCVTEIWLARGTGFTRVWRMTTQPVRLVGGTLIEVKASGRDCPGGGSCTLRLDFAGGTPRLAN